MVLVRVALAVIASYLLGSLPFGVMAARLRGRDPREVGSGRTGGTNVYRTAGLPAAVLTVVLDAAKGFAAVKISFWLVPAADYGSAAGWAAALGALAAILGHNHSVFLGFRGGAGTTPNLGAALAFDPRVFVAGLAAGLIGLFGIRIASIGSIIASVVIALAFGWKVIDGSAPPSILLYAFGQLVMILWALRPNIARLRSGTERRIAVGRRSGNREAADA